MIALVPGYGEAFGDSLAALLSGVRAQISLPVPWPWALEQLPDDLLSRGHFLATSFAFVLLPTTYAVAAVAIARAEGEVPRLPPLLLASTCVGVVYLHHAFSRPDFSHLAQSAHPWILCVVGLACFRAGRRALSFRLAAVSLLVAFTILGPGTVQRSLVYMRLARDQPAAVTTLRIDGHPFTLRAHEAAWLKATRDAFERYAGRDRSMLIAPHYPFFYAYLGCAAPSWELYYLWSVTTEQQEERIRELEGNRVTAIMIAPGVNLDGRKELAFVNTHPLVWAYIRANYTLRRPAGLPQHVHLFTRSANSFDDL
jgi:hypothetical protein